MVYADNIVDGTYGPSNRYIRPYSPELGIASGQQSLAAYIDAAGWIRQAGEACPSVTGAYVMLRVEDYELVRGGFTGFNLADVAAILPAVALVWAVAWLFKRLLAVLRNQL